MKTKKKHTIPRWKKLLAAGLAALAVGGGAIAANNINYFRGEKVIDVVDGDTFVIDNQTSVRLFGVNAPELKNCMGRDAKNALSKLILGKRVQLRQPMSEGLGRVLAIVYVDNILINEVMVKSGLAESNWEGTNQKARMQAANNYARNNRIGIFSKICTQYEPPDPACAIKGNFNTKEYTKIFYTPTCPYYKQVIIMKYQGDAWFCTEAEAKKAGFIKSDMCK